MHWQITPEWPAESRGRVLSVSSLLKEFGEGHVVSFVIPMKARMTLDFQLAGRLIFRCCMKPNSIGPTLMFASRAVFFLVVALWFWASESALAQARPAAYPIKLDATDVHELKDFEVQANGLKISSKELLVVPIHCAPGITGAVLIGNGEYSFSTSDGKKFEGVFRAAMLRFAPDDQSMLLPLDKSTAVTDHAAYEMSQHLLNDVFRHCWHSGKDALIPDAGSFVANVYSKTEGDLLISTGGNSSVVHSFTAGKTLYQVK